jgi:hypothetical protein
MTLFDWICRIFGHRKPKQIEQHGLYGHYCCKLCRREVMEPYL